MTQPHSCLSLTLLLGFLSSCATAPVVAPVAALVAPSPPVAGHVALQLGPAFGLVERLLLPGGAVDVVFDDGVSFFDERLQRVTANLFTPYRPTTVIPLAGTGDVVLVLRDPRELNARIVERWALATGVRRWSTALQSRESWRAGETLDRLGFAGGQVLLSRCQRGVCEVSTLGAADGRLQAAPVDVEVGALPVGWRETSSHTARFSVREGSGPEGAARTWWLFDVAGRMLAGFTARCVRFDAAGALLHDGVDERNLPWLERQGLHPTATTAACVAPALPTQSLAAHAQSHRPVITPTELLWQYGGAGPAFALPLEQVALPAPRAAPLPGDWWLQELGAEVMWSNSTSGALVEEVAGQPPRSGVTPHRGVLLQRSADGQALLAGWLAPATGETWRLSLGTRATRDDDLVWRDLEALATADPDFALTRVGDKTIATISGHRFGLQRVDVATGKLLSRRCTTPVTATGECSADTWLGPVAQLVPGRVWVLHVVRRTDTSRTATLEEFDVGAGTVLRSAPMPLLSPQDSPADFRAGAFVDGHTLWVAGPREDLSSVGVGVVTVDATGAAATRQLQAPGGASAFEGDALGRFFVVNTSSTLDVYTPAGMQVLRLGGRGRAAYALAADGRFACTGEACQALQCIVGDRAFPADAPACAPTRREGFRMLDEVRSTASR